MGVNSQQGHASSRMEIFKTDFRLSGEKHFSTRAIPEEASDSDDSDATFRQLIIRLCLPGKAERGMRCFVPWLSSMPVLSSSDTVASSYVPVSGAQSVWTSGYAGEVMEIQAPLTS